MNSQHTTGPWHVVNEDGKPVVKSSDDFYITNTIDAAGYDSNDDTKFANARLIAAAPEMLDALKVAEQFLSIASDWNMDEAEINGEMRSTYDWLDLIRAAITKATGGGV